MEKALEYIEKNITVATVLTVYGIETALSVGAICSSIGKVATVLTVYGIETGLIYYDHHVCRIVATVLTVYGIETLLDDVVVLPF